jgi:16S rRNA (cytidine1402-2'-O)-methyltransferase
MTLFLLPNLLSPLKEHHIFLPSSVDQAVAQIDGLIAESESEGRRYLKRFATKKKAHEMPIALLSKNFRELDFLLEPLLKGENWGVVSDCGLPCLADPGAALVMRARQLRIPIKTFTGPSSLIYALLLSGLSGQSFFFHGYLPKQPADRIQTLKQWEKMRGTTHLFIEAPYRNLHTYKAALETLHNQTLFCVATSLTSPEEYVNTLPISLWKKSPPPDIAKKPTIFLFTPP